jgi:hypothetical protein
MFSIQPREAPTRPDGSAERSYTFVGAIPRGRPSLLAADSTDLLTRPVPMLTKLDVTRRSSTL